jgi:lipopolysaccharide/colanic/teichoic acid biosynthesis glycosyltransferase
MTGRRAFDLLGAGLALVATALPLALAMLLVRTCDGAPVFFRQERLGRGRRPFRILKLRTMAAGRVTRLGAVLRNLGLDELPQLWNVLRGEMALVGPRPLTAADVQRLGWQGPRFDLRWTVCPGITGLAQIAPARLCHVRTTWRLDRAYVLRAGRATDLGIVAATMLVPLLGKRRARGALGLVTGRRA